MTHDFSFTQKTYSEQRKDRLYDAVDDYLNDEKVSPQEFYDDLVTCMQESANFYRKNLERVTSALELVKGHRLSPPLDDELIEKWMLEKHKIPDRY